MSKRLKSFHKLFFIVIFSILFSGVIGSSSSPELPEKIAPELEQIEALPRRTKPAELNIEVIKIKSEPLEEISIDTKTKNIYIDFSKEKQKNLKNFVNANIDDFNKKYNLIITTTIKSEGASIKNKKINNNNNFQTFSYETEEINGKNMLKIPYETLPEKLYISINDTEKEEIIKIYSLDIKKHMLFQSDSSQDSGELIGEANGWATFFDEIGMKEPPKAPLFTVSNTRFFTRAQTSATKLKWFPVMGLGQPTPVNDPQHKGWEFNLTRAELTPQRISREPVYTNYELTGLGLEPTIPTDGSKYPKINMEMYFENNIHLQYIDETFISESSPGKNNFIGGISYNSDSYEEFIAVRGIKAQTKNEGVFLEIIKALREIDSFYCIYESKDQSQITFKRGQYTKGSSSQEDRFDWATPEETIKAKYGKIIFGKSTANETYTVTLSEEDYNIENPIVFTTNGIEDVIGAKLTSSSGNLYMKSLGLTPTTINISTNEQNLKNNAVDAAGNSSTIRTITRSTTSTEKLELDIKYTNGYPTFKILNKPIGTYSILINHYEASGMWRMSYTLNIVIEPVKEFEVTSNMRDITIIPSTEPGKSPTIEFPDNWVKVTQLVSTKEKFPVIAVNRPKWVMETNTPFNPTDKRPLAALNLGGKIITVPVNIKETPYQNVEKFFIYDRGDMTNKNLAVGGYTSLTSLNGSGKNNQVKVNFEILLEEKHINEILDYATTQPGDRVEIPYASSQDPTIYSIRGLQNSTLNKQFIVNEANILSYGIVNFPKIVVLKKNIINKNLEIELQPNYSGEKITFDSDIPPSYDSNLITINPSNDNTIMEGLNSKHNIKIILPNGKEKNYTTSENGSIYIAETIEKNGESLKLYISYISNTQIQVWIKDRIGNQVYDLALKHIDLDGKLKKVINMRIKSLLETKSGEMNLVISSRYNAAESGLNSNPIGITSNGITYQSQVLDLNLISGIYPESPGKDKQVYINDKPLANLGTKGEITLTNGTILKITQEKNGDLKIKPLYWKNNSTDIFKITYKSNNIVTNEYTFNVRCPNFFVASTGELDFGKIYTNTQDLTKTTNIELQYNSSNIKAKYSLDVAKPNEDGTMANSLYLDNDNKTLLVKDLYIKNEVINSNDNTKRTLSLTGTVDGPSVKNTPEGSYQKTIQILIHLE